LLLQDQYTDRNKSLNTLGYQAERNDPDYVDAGDTANTEVGVARDRQLPVVGERVVVLYPVSHVCSSYRLTLTEILPADCERIVSAT